MDQQLVYNLNQAAINGIRASGATTQYITPEGNSWTGMFTSSSPSSPPSSHPHVSCPLPSHRTKTLG